MRLSLTLSIVGFCRSARDYKLLRIVAKLVVQGFKVMGLFGPNALSNKKISVTIISVED